MKKITGREVIASAAEIYPQLYLNTDDEGRRQYGDVVLKGTVPQVRRLDHFITDEGDSWVQEDTPAGAVDVITLVNREDFELFYRIMGCKCCNDEVPPTMGGVILDGVVNWDKIRGHKHRYTAQCMENGTECDWKSEFKRFTADKANYRDALIILSCGGYSGFSGDSFGFSEDEWRAYSHKIRKAHECTHFICRRLFHDQIEPVWDEIVADAAGIVSAFRHFDAKMECAFLGVDENGYTGGRLENYTDREAIGETARRVYDVIMSIDGLCRENSGITPYDLAIMLEKKQHELWK